MDLYRVKPALLRGLDPVLAWLERAGVRPDVLTLGAIPVGAIAGIAILASPTAPLVLVLVPLAAAARLILNLLDGALARRTGMIHAKGELFNEVGDRLADVLMLAPVAFVPGAHQATVLLGVTMAVLASFTSVATKAAGGTRSYRGILSKPGRMVLLSVTAIAVIVVGPAAWGPFGPLLLHRDVAHPAGAGHRRHPGAPVTPTQLAAATLIVIAGIGIVVAVLVGPLASSSRDHGSGGRPRQGDELCRTGRHPRDRHPDRASGADGHVRGDRRGRPAGVEPARGPAGRTTSSPSRSEASRSWSRRPCTARRPPTCSSAVSCWPVL